MEQQEAADCSHHLEGSAVGVERSMEVLLNRTAVRAAAGHKVPPQVVPKVQVLDFDRRSLVALVAAVDKLHSRAADTQSGAEDFAGRDLVVHGADTHSDIHNHLGEGSDNHSHHCDTHAADRVAEHSEHYFGYPVEDKRSEDRYGDRHSGDHFGNHNSDSFDAELAGQDGEQGTEVRVENIGPADIQTG